MARGLVERVRSFWRICIGARDGSRDKKTKRVPTTPRPHYPVCKALRRWYESYHEKHAISVLSPSLCQRLCHDFRGFTRPAALLARVIRLSSRDDDEIIAS